MNENENMSFDVVIIGAGPSGLASAIRLSQNAKKANKEISICILEKGSEVGAHILSGCVLEMNPLTKLLPNWKELSSPIKTPALKDKFYFLSKNKAIRLPTPSQMNNKGNYIISLSQVCRWLALQAEKLGVMIIPGYAAQDVIFNDNNQVCGVVTGDMGRNKDYSKGPQFQAGVKIYAKQIILAEGCRGSVSEKIINHYNLRAKSQAQTYAIGVKEVWEIDKKNYDNGLVIHSIGWPLDKETYSGGFLYHYNENRISIGLVIGLDWKNPFLDPQRELQKYKLHPLIKSFLQNGKCIAYGARALNEGGWQAIPKLAFPGGVLVGCAAGFVDIAKIKGTHNAIESGILAADSIFKHITQKNTTTTQTSIINTQQNTTTTQKSKNSTDNIANTKNINTAKKTSTDENICNEYETKLHSSSIGKSLYKVRNIRPGFYKGLYFGLINAAWETISFGKSPWTLATREDHIQLEKHTKHKPIDYPKPDEKIILSKLFAVRLSATNHAENQPCHLILKDPKKAIKINYNIYRGPESYYCPANVYEYIDVNGKKQLQINSQNCIHCKACSIKDPTQNITWVPPEGGQGPLYTET